MSRSGAQAPRLLCGRSEVSFFYGICGDLGAAMFACRHPRELLLMAAGIGNARSPCPLDMNPLR